MGQFKTVEDTENARKLETLIGVVDQNAKGCQLLSDEIDRLSRAVSDISGFATEMREIFHKEISAHRWEKRTRRLAPPD